jgi:hypothetical protein
MPSLTKKQLVQVVAEFNDVMALDPPIKKTNPNAKLEADIKEAAEELRDTDKFSPEVEKVLVRLGIRQAPDDLEKDKEEPKDELKKKATGKKKAEPKEKAAPKTTPTKKSSGVSGTAFITHLICDDPEISNDDIAKALDKKGYSVSKNTMSFHAGWTRRVMRYLQEKGRLK